MPRSRTRSLALALTGLGAVSGAQAVPLTPSPAAPTLTETVALGCGPGWTRGAYGRCRPFIAAPPLDDLRCFWRRTPFGPRRVCRW